MYVTNSCVRGVGVFGFGVRRSVVGWPFRSAQSQLHVVPSHRQDCKLSLSLSSVLLQTNKHTLTWAPVMHLPQPKLILFTCSGINSYRYIYVWMYAPHVHNINIGLSAGFLKFFHFFSSMENTGRFQLIQQDIRYTYTILITSTIDCRMFTNKIQRPEYTIACVRLYTYMYIITQVHRQNWNSMKIYYLCEHYDTYNMK